MEGSWRPLDSELLFPRLLTLGIVDLVIFETVPARETEAAA
jgi:hypothetical protein